MLSADSQSVPFYTIAPAGTNALNCFPDCDRSSVRRQFHRPRRSSGRPPIGVDAGEHFGALSIDCLPLHRPTEMNHFSRKSSQAPPAQAPNCNEWSMVIKFVKRDLPGRHHRRTTSEMSLWWRFESHPHTG